MIAALTNKVGITSNDVLRSSSHSSSPLSKVQESGRYGNFNFATIFIQPKLKINPSNDPYEQEADRIAQKIVQMKEVPSIEGNGQKAIHRKPLADEISYLGGTIAQRKCSKCNDEEEEPIQRKSSNANALQIPTSFTDQLSATRGGGSPLDRDTHSFMSSRFGVDFSNVRIHNDSKAHEMSQGIQAKAFTRGKDIYFNQGAYAPHTQEGKELLAHELVHTVQQGGSNKTHIQRSFLGFFRNIGRAIASIFADEPDYDEQTITEYLDVLNEGSIEDDFDSDNKARFVVKLWKNGERELSVNIKILLIREMMSGFTGDADEQAILDILNGSPASEVTQIRAAIPDTELLDEFHGEESTDLENLLSCDEDMIRRIREARPLARSLLNDALRVLNDDSYRPFVDQSLWLMFRSRSEQTYTHVKNILSGVKNQFAEIEFSCTDETEDATCNDASAFVTNHSNPVHLCTNNEDQYRERRAMALLMLHEAAHLFYEEIDDFGYHSSDCNETLEKDVRIRDEDELDETEIRNKRREKATENDPSSERLNNADSYECFINILSRPALVDDRENYENEIDHRVEVERGDAIKIDRRSDSSFITENEIDLNDDTIFDPVVFDFELDDLPTTSDIKYQWNLVVLDGSNPRTVSLGSGATASIENFVSILRSEGVTKARVTCDVNFLLIRGSAREDRTVTEDLNIVNREIFSRP